MSQPVPKRKAPLVPFGLVPIQTDAEIAEAARITRTDFEAAKAWVRTFQRAALVVDVIANRPARYLSASIYKRLWEAKTQK